MARVEVTWGAKVTWGVEAYGQHCSHWWGDKALGCLDCSSSTFCLNQKMVSLLSREEAGAFVRAPVRSRENK